MRNVSKRKLKKLVAVCATFATLALAAGDVKAEPVSTAIAVFLYEAGVAAATAYAIGQAVVTFAISTALSYAVGAITQSSQGGYSSRALADRTHMVRSSVAPRTIVYGRSMVSGPLAFMATTDQTETTANSANELETRIVMRNGYLHMIVMLAGHEIDGVEEIYLGDQPLGVLVNGFATAAPFGNVSTDEHVATNFKLPANVDVINLPGLGAQRIVSLDVGDPTPVTYDIEGGQVTIPPVTAPLPYTLESDTLLRVPSAPTERAVYINYISKGIPRSHVRAKIYLGTDTQEADPDLIAECPDLWTSSHRLRGIAYVYLRLAYHPKIFPNGIPNVRALIRGAKLNDPRNGAYPNDTPTWRANYALCALHYLKSAHGLGCTDADIDLDQVKIAANVCDEGVAIRPAPFNQPFGGGETQPRYEAHGVIQLDHDVEQNLRALSTAGGGPVPLIVGGRFHIPVAYYGTPVARVLTESDLRGPVKVRPRVSRRDLFNSVGGTYVDGAISWQPTDFPEVVNALYQSQDAGEKIRRDMTYSFTTNEQTAQRLAKITLERARQAIAIEWPGKPCCFPYTVNDLVPVTLAKFGWTNKVFRVVSWSMNASGGIDLGLQEDAPGVYDWSMGAATVTDLARDTDLPDPSYVEPVGALTLRSGDAELLRTGDGAVISRLRASWPSSSDAGVINGGSFEVDYKTTFDVAWTAAPRVPGASDETYLSPVSDERTYIVRVRAVNARGIPTDWVYGTHTVTGKSAPPPNVESFSITNGVLSWPAVAAPDLAGYRVRFQYGENRVWSNAQPLHNGLVTQSPFRPYLIPPGVCTIMVKAVDMSGNESQNAAFIVANLGDVIVDNVILTYDDRAAGFPGARVNSSVVDGNLIANDTGGNYWTDDNAPHYSAEGVNYWATITYAALEYVTQYVTQYEQADSRMTLDVVVGTDGQYAWGADAATFYGSDTLGFWVLPIAYSVEFRYGTQGVFWGADASPFFPTEAAALVWTSPTAWQPWPGAIDNVGENSIDFRITAQGGTLRGGIYELAVNFDVPDQIEDLNDIAISAAGTALPLSLAYRSIRNVQLTLQDTGSAAVVAKCSDKATSGPIVYCYNASGSKVSGIIDARIQGVKG